MTLKLKDEKKSSPRQMINQQIPFAEILLVGDGNEQANEIISKQKALMKAQQQGLDLVCFRSPDPDKKTLAVCKIVDYQKYLFEANKKNKVQKKISQKPTLKKIGLTFHIGEGDLKNKIKQIKKWLESSYSVKVSLKMIGREQAHKDLVLEKCQKFIADLQEQSEKIKLQGEIKLQGKVYSFLLQKSK